MAAGRFSILAASQPTQGEKTLLQQHAQQANTATAVIPQSSAQQVSTPSPQSTSDIPPQPFNDNTLAVEWRTFAENLPHEDVALSTRMKNTEPKINEDGSTIEVEVDNKNVVDLFQKNAGRILQKFSRVFGRNDLRLHATINEEAKQKVFHSRAEQFQMMCKENEALQKMLEEFDLILG
jgi:DNA polymerase-3 subunit gamma/tau